jgi:hypothetical protein
VGEAALSTEESRGQRDENTGGFSGRLTQRPGDDVLETAHVDQLEGQRPGTGLLQPSGAVLLGQTQKLLGLTELAPGEIARQELFGKAADMSPELAGFGDDAVGITAGIGGQRLGVVVVISRASARLLRQVRLDQLFPEIDAHERAVSADGHLAPQIGRGHGVEALAKLYMVIGVDGALGPVRRVESLAGDRQQ